jgi:hypothetical protein
MLGLIPFILCAIFLIACMFKKFSDANYMCAIYTSKPWVKILSCVGMIGFFVYSALCQDWIPNPWALEWNAHIGFAIYGASMLLLATGSWGEGYED